MERRRRSGRCWVEMFWVGMFWAGMFWVGMFWVGTFWVELSGAEGEGGGHRLGSDCDGEGDGRQRWQVLKLKGDGMVEESGGFSRERGLGSWDEVD